MADFEEIFSDAGDSLKDAGKDIKKVFKKNPFLLACIGVGGVGLLVWYLREKNGTAAGGGEAYTLSYSGYPSGGDASVSEEYWQTVFDAMGEEMEMLKDQNQTDLDNLNSAWQDKYDSLLEKLDGGATNDGGSVSEHYGSTNRVNSPKTQLTFREVVDQMQFNSNMAIFTDGMDEDLHKQNQQLARTIGAEYDPSTGTWWYSNHLLYSYGTEYEDDGGDNFLFRDPDTLYVTYDSTTDYQGKINKAILNKEGGALINSLNVQRDSKIEGSGKSVESANAHYDKDTDYMALINAAKAQGADESVIENLTQMREAKIKGEQMTHRYDELRK